MRNRTQDIYGPLDMKQSIRFAFLRKGIHVHNLQDWQQTPAIQQPSAARSLALVLSKSLQLRDFSPVYLHWTC